MACKACMIWPWLLHCPLYSPGSSHTDLLGTCRTHLYLRAFVLAIPSLWNILLSTFCVISSFSWLGLSSTVTSERCCLPPTQLGNTHTHTHTQRKRYFGYFLLSFFHESLHWVYGVPNCVPIKYVLKKIFAECLHYELISGLTLSVGNRSGCKEDPVPQNNSGLTRWTLTFLCLSLVFSRSWLWDKDSSKSALSGR